tara:strand:+ start:9017 stop:9388 length:372 start_codon:yes stop_codon:yes gene_type:complete
MKKKNTIFCDIDGTIFKYRKFETYKKSEAVPTLNTVKILQRWRDNGHMIVLTTARPENLRKHTLDELKNNNIPFDRLIMEIERGPRFLINDMDPSKPGERAIAINLLRDLGLGSVYWDQWKEM